MNTDKRNVVYVGGIGNAEGEDVVRKGGIVDLLNGASLKDVVTMHERNGKKYALIKMPTEDLALKAIEQLHKKELIKGQKLSALFFHAQRYFIEYTIGKDKNGYKQFIKDLRVKLHGKDPKYVENMIKDDEGKDRKIKKPVLPVRLRGKQPEKWIEIQLSTKVGSETSTTTLVIRNDNLYVEGFKNQQGKWFELRGPDEKGWEKLPAEDYYEAEEVGWGVSYSSMMGLQDSVQVKSVLKTARLGKAFAERAVRRLSNYPDDDEYNDDMPVRLGLAGLVVMICEAARMVPFLDHFADEKDGAWDLEMGLKDKHFVFLWNWQNMSAALLKKNNNPYRPWDSKCGVGSPGEAFDGLHLVRNSTRLNTCDGPQVVEILDVLVNFSVREIKFIDEAQQDYNSYTEKPDEMQRHKLEVTVPGSKCITGYKWFGMKVATPASTGDGGDSSITREFKCDCRNQAGGVATDYVAHTMYLDEKTKDLDCSNKIEVTYLVMSNNATEVVTVEVKLRFDPDLEQEDQALSNKYTAHGEITAHIGGFEDHPIVLFRSKDPRLLKSEPLMVGLDRSAVHVPRDTKQLKIGIKELHITETSGDGKKQREMKKPAGDDDGRLSFQYGGSCPTTQVENEYDDSEVQVIVTWKNKAILPIHVCTMTIGSIEEFSRSINDLLEMLVDDDEQFSGIKMLTRKRAKQPQQWIHVELKVKEDGKEKWSITLAVQDGKCYGVGFLNQSQLWYDLGNGNQGTLPPEYNSVRLRWGVSYDEILGHGDDSHRFYGELNEEGLGKKSFAEKAVRTLSRYPDVDKKEDMKPRVALAGLIIMVCESARFTHVHKYFTENWDKTTQQTSGFSFEQMKYIWSWGKISRSLLLCNDNGEWPDDDQTNILKGRGIENKDDALAAVRLVYSDALTLQFRLTPGGSVITGEEKEWNE